jgi:hypothetical protein
MSMRQLYEYDPIRIFITDRDSRHQGIALEWNPMVLADLP